MIEGILLAEFDIEQGSGLTLCHPPWVRPADDAACHEVAELMLPDGAHLREEDWTVFFLTQQAVSDGYERVRRPESEAMTKCM